jgi:DNA-binding transcriptional regulator GbsR (MarR family)
MAGRAFGALLSTERGSASAGELGDLLSASPAAVSVAVNYLIQVGMVSRSRELGQRRDRYTVDDDVWMNLISGRAQELNRWVAALDEGVKAVGPETSAGRRLRRTQSLLEFLAGEIPGMVARWRELEGNSSSEAEG